MKQVVFRGAIDGAVRTAEFRGTQHVVVPVVALVEGVMHAVNSPYPELVLAEEFSRVPQGWNGRPVMPSHPAMGGNQVSANDPKVLETNCFGYIFNSRVDDKKLLMEAWLNPTSAELVGEDAVSVIARARKGEAIEISVGAFVTPEIKSGEYQGKHYEAIWRDIVPDHLAMLPKGDIGACSVDMGCGAPRAAKGQSMEDDIKQRSLRERLMSLMKFRSNAGTAADMSDQDLRNALDVELRAIEPGYLGIDSVFPADGLVVYAVMPKDSIILLRRSYSITSRGMKLGESAEEVQAVTTYEPLKTAEEKPCGCSGGPIMHRNAERIKALIECPKTPWTSDDQSYLESLSDEKLATYEAHRTSLIQPAPAPEPEPVVAKASAPQSEEDFLKNAPQSIRDLVDRHKKAETAKREVLIGTLKSAQSVYSESEMQTMSLEDLEKLSKLISPADFSGFGFPRVASDRKDDVYANPPDPYAEGLKRLQ